LKVLDQILQQYRVVQHGVSTYFGSAEPLNREHLKKLKRLFDPLPQPELIEERVDRQLPAMGARLLGRTKLNLEAGLLRPRGTPTSR
jgi:hypothetical protein